MKFGAQQKQCFQTLRSIFVFFPGSFRENFSGFRSAEGLISEFSETAWNMSSKSGPCSSSEEDAVFLLDFFQVAESRCEGIRLNVIILPPRFPAFCQAKIVPESALRGEISWNDQIEPVKRGSRQEIRSRYARVRGPWEERPL